MNEMELDLNKEMEVLLRRAGEGSSSPPVGPHLDADLISAFASNAVPAQSRPNLVLHLADCGRCRSILAEAMRDIADVEETETKVLPLPAIPWYTAILKLPKMTYVTAALMILFGGIAVFFVSQNVRQGTTEVSKAIEPTQPTATQRSAEIPSPSQPTASSPNPSEETKSAMTPPAPPTAPPPSAAKLKEAAAPPQAAEQFEPPMPTAAAPPPPQASERAAAADEQKDVEGDRGAERKAAASSAPMRAQKAEIPSSTETASGKTFVRRNGVAVDSAYQGQATTAVRRGSDEFKKLDAGLRSIANQIGGQVIVVWKGRAYRIE